MYPLQIIAKSRETKTRNEYIFWRQEITRMLASRKDQLGRESHDRVGKLEQPATACRSSRAGLSPVLLISSYRALYTREGHNYPQEDGRSALNILALAPCSIADLSLFLRLFSLLLF